MSNEYPQNYEDYIPGAHAAEHRGTPEQPYAEVVSAHPQELNVDPDQRLRPIDYASDEALTGGVGAPPEEAGGHASVGLPVADASAAYHGRRRRSRKNGEGTELGSHSSDTESDDGVVPSGKQEPVATAPRRSREEVLADVAKNRRQRPPRGAIERIAAEHRARLRARVGDFDPLNDIDADYRAESAYDDDDIDDGYTDNEPYPHLQRVDYDYDGYGDRGDDYRGRGEIRANGYHPIVLAGLNAEALKEIEDMVATGVDAHQIEQRRRILSKWAHDDAAEARPAYEEWRARLAELRRGGYRDDAAEANEDHLVDDDETSPDTERRGRSGRTLDYLRMLRAQYVAEGPAGVADTLVTSLRRSRRGRPESAGDADLLDGDEDWDFDTAPRERVVRLFAGVRQVFGSATEELAQRAGFRDREQMLRAGTARLAGALVSAREFINAYVYESEEPSHRRTRR